MKTTLPWVMTVMCKLEHFLAMSCWTRLAVEWVFAAYRYEQFSGEHNNSSNIYDEFLTFIHS